MKQQLILSRQLDLNSKIKKKSHFLFGPRSTGKTKLIEFSFKKNTLYINLLDHLIYHRLLKEPSLLRQLIAKNHKIVVIDEIQKLPVLLDEVHNLIEKTDLKFLLTGSSARKLKRGQANMLAGRAWACYLFPLTWKELGAHFNLEKYLNRGGLPQIYFSDHYIEEQQAYAQIYLKEEIQAEALVKRFDHFSRFLDVAALCSGEELNYESVASDCSVPARTVNNFFEILEDTLLGFSLEAFQKTKKRKAVKRAKFYFFDVGIAGFLSQRGLLKPKSELWGKAFEHFIIQEVRAYISYRNNRKSMHYWRSLDQYEVDLILDNKVAIEIKSTSSVQLKHLKGLLKLAEEKIMEKLILISEDPLERNLAGVNLYQWESFLQNLWAGKII